jgi:3-methyladenine DNA glycosylase AlkC
MEPLKNALGTGAIGRLSQSVQRVIPVFDAGAFRLEAEQALANLPLKARVSALVQLLDQSLPPFAEVAPALCDLPAQWDAGDPNDPYRGFAAWPVIDYVAHAGLEYPDAALPLLARLTPLFSAEFAVRPFIERYPDRLQSQLLAWAEDPDPHVRRLASEGSRPRLPWGMQLSGRRESPELAWPLLSRLKADSSRYVQKSVANHLNDLTKDHADAVVAVCRDWLSETSVNPVTQWVVKHGLRTLIKQGHAGALSLVGVVQQPVSLHLEADAAVSWSGQLAFQVDLQASLEAPLVLDFAIVFARQKGRQTAKVFKWKHFTPVPGEDYRLNKHYSFAPISTRRYYPGAHQLQVYVNGELMASAVFELLPPVLAESSLR